VGGVDMKNWRTILSYRIQRDPEVGDIIRVKAFDPMIEKDASVDIFRQIFKGGILGKVVNTNDLKYGNIEVVFRFNTGEKHSWTLHNMDKFHDYYEIVG
jgi:hypothetical protein